MADLITVAQFTDRTGRTLTATQTIQVEALITDASALVVDIVNDSTITDAWLTAPAALVPVIVNMVRRGLDNPHGFGQESQGDYTYSTPNTSGIFANKHEIRAIRKAAGTSGIAALNLESDLPYRAHIAWLDGAL